MAISVPSYDLRACDLSVVAALCAEHHGYGSTGASATYAFAVYEDERPVAAFVWQPPPPGAAKSVCSVAPHGVLALSRMVAVPREERRLRHISKPLKRQMAHLIDRTRWPALVTYSDEGQGHTGHVYKCSGWEKTSRTRSPVYEDAQGRRVSSYSRGRHNVEGKGLVRAGTTWIQRWEHFICDREDVVDWMAWHGWCRVARAGKWRSGASAGTYVKVDLKALLLESCG